MTRGLAAGIAGTGAMTAWQSLSSRLQSSQPSGEDSEQPRDPWEQAPAPAQVGKRIAEPVLGREISSDLIPALTNVMHWGYGISWGAAYGLVAPSLRRRPPLRLGALFGTGVWLVSYLTLVPMGLYQPPWRYPPGELALDLSYHLAYGVGTGVAFELVAPGR